MPIELRSAELKPGRPEHGVVVVERPLGREELPVADRRRVLQRQRDDPDDRDQRVEQDDDRPDAPQDLLTGCCSFMVGYLRCRARAQEAGEDERDQDHADEDQDRDGRAEPEVEPVDELLVAEDRHRLGVVGAAGHDEHGVVDAERVERPEQQRHHQRRPDQRQRDLPEALPRARAVHLRRLVEVVRHERQTSQQQQGDEGRRLPDLRHDDHEERAPAGRQRRRVDVEQAGHEAGRRVERQPPGERGDDRDGAVRARAPTPGSPCGRRSPGTSPARSACRARARASPSRR